MDISIKKVFIHLTLSFPLFLIGCSTGTKSDTNEILVKIGNFSVDCQQYENQLKKLIIIYDELTQEEVALFLLDNYISAGLLIETAKKLNYEHHPDFIREDLLYRDELIIKYSKYLRAGISKNLRDEYLIQKAFQGEIMQDDIRIDYIRIPKKHKDLSEFIFNFMPGNSLENILTNPEMETWDSKELSFYENLSLKHAILTDKIKNQIRLMQDEEVKMITTSSAYHLVRRLKPVRPPASGDESEDSILLNQIMARSLEKGDIIFDPYRFEKNIQCNEILLSKIDFSIAPFYSDCNSVADLCGRLISEEEIKEKITKLPVKIQSLFINKSTRIKSIATFVLLNFYPENNSTNFQKVSDWLQPHKLIGYNQLKLDFGKIENMEIIPDNSLDNQILAYSDNWNIRMKDFKKELDLLSPKTRIELANRNLLNEMIQYLAKRDSGIDSQVIIHSDLFEYIDIMGMTYDQINYIINEDALVGTLNTTNLSVKELRELVAKLREVDKNKFLDLGSRREGFNEIIANKFWLNIYDRKIIEDNPDFKKEISNYQNKLLVELLYKYQIQTEMLQIDNEQLNEKNRYFIESITEDKLLSYIQELIRDYPIRVNINFFQENLNLDIESSMYHKVMINNIN